jgi:hypothetical protein
MTKVYTVTVRKHIEVTVLIKAFSEDDAMVQAWAHLPDEVDEWNCDSTTHQVEEWVS